MTTVSTKSGRIIKVVSREEEKSTLTESDNEMDERAVEAVIITAIFILCHQIHQFQVNFSTTKQYCPYDFYAF